MVAWKTRFLHTHIQVKVRNDLSTFTTRGMKFVHTHFLIASTMNMQNAGICVTLRVNGFLWILHISMGNFSIDARNSCIWSKQDGVCLDDCLEQQNLDFDFLPRGLMISIFLLSCDGEFSIMVTISKDTDLWDLRNSFHKTSSHDLGCNVC